MNNEEIIQKNIKGNIEVYNENKELITIYNEYIGKIVEFFDFIRKDESDFFYTIVFDIFTNIGLFTHERNLNNHAENFKELFIRPGISIVNGEGVCRNIACFYQDIFSYFYNYPLLFCCLDPQGEHGEDEFHFGNHVINLTSHNGLIYGFDATNHCAFKPASNDSMNGIGFDYPLTFTPQGNLYLGLKSMLEDNRRFIDERDMIERILKETKKEKFMTKEDFDKLVADANAFIIERKKIVQDFLVKNEDLTYEIHKKMLLLK